jgi:hypothetical protein
METLRPARVKWSELSMVTRDGSHAVLGVESRIACCSLRSSFGRSPTMPQSAPQRNQKSAGRAPAPQPLPNTTTADTEDHVYGLVSVLYHALQGVQACEQYIADAERAEDDELVKFFEECRDEQNERASRAKRLLVQRAEDDVEEEEDDEDDEEDDEDEDDEES